MQEKLYTIEETAEYLRVSVYTVRNWIREGRLRATKYGQQWRIAESDIKAFGQSNIEGSEKK